MTTETRRIRSCLLRPAPLTVGESWVVVAEGVGLAVVLVLAAIGLAWVLGILA